MPVYQRIVNFDQMFKQLREPPIIVNDLINSTVEEKEAIGELIASRCSPDMLSMLPSCACGETKGEYASKTVCDVCGTPVRSSMSDDIEPILWFRRPEGVERLINPIFWIMLKKRFRKSGYSILQWIADSTYRPNIKQPIIIDKIAALGIQRGYNYFVSNFDEIMNALFSIKEFMPLKGKRDYLYELLQLYRDRVFSDYLPLPNKTILIIEKTNVGRYVDISTPGAIDAIGMITSIDSQLIEHSLQVKQNRTIKAIVKLSEFYEAYIGSSVSGKTGAYRKHVFGARTHFSFRAVVTSLTKPHQYDEIHVPWGIGVTAFRPHLINKLMKRGFDYNQAVGFLYGHVENYHPLINELLNELITETKYGKIPCLIQRN